MRSSPSERQSRPGARGHLAASRPGSCCDPPASLGKHIANTIGFMPQSATKHVFRLNETSRLRFQGRRNHLATNSVQRRRRWSTEEKVRIVEETYLPGNSVSLVARRHGIAANQLFTWRRLMAQGALTAAGAGEQVVPASELRAAHQQIRE